MSAKRKLTEGVGRQAYRGEIGPGKLWDTLIPGFYIEVGKRAVSWKFYGRTKKKDDPTRQPRQFRETLGRCGVMSAEDARAEARRLEQLARDGRTPADERAERQAAVAAQEDLVESYAFKDLAKDFIARRLKGTPRGKERERFIRKELIPAWSDRDVRSIRRREIKLLVESKAEDAPVSANRLLGVIKTLFNHLLDDEIVETNPAARITPPGGEGSRDRFLELAEIRGLWEALDAIDKPYTDAVKLLLLTGQRRGEVSGMCWDQLDLEAGLWRMPADLSYKNTRGNDVPLSDLALDIITRQPTREGVPYVFVSRGGPIRGWSRVKDRIVEQLDQGTLDGASWNFHDLRRTVATHLARIGINQRVINQLLNHEGDPRRDPAPDAEPPSAAAVSRIYNRYSYLREKAEAVTLWENEVRRIIAARDDSKNEAA